jgi:hypothetical protein
MIDMIQQYTPPAPAEGYGFSMGHYRHATHLDAEKAVEEQAASRSASSAPHLSHAALRKLLVELEYLSLTDEGVVLAGEPGKVTVRSGKALSSRLLEMVNSSSWARDFAYHVDLHPDKKKGDWSRIAVSSGVVINVAVRHQDVTVFSCFIAADACTATTLAAMPSGENPTRVNVGGGDLWKSVYSFLIPYQSGDVPKTLRLWDSPFVFRRQKYASGYLCSELGLLMQFRADDWTPHVDETLCSSLQAYPWTRIRGGLVRSGSVTLSFGAPRESPLPGDRIIRPDSLGVARGAVAALFRILFDVVYSINFYRSLDKSLDRMSAHDRETEQMARTILRALLREEGWEDDQSPWAQLVHVLCRNEVALVDKDPCLQRCSSFVQDMLNLRALARQVSEHLLVG